MHVTIVYFEEIIVHTGLEVASTTSRYRKLVVSSEYEMNFTEWTFWCSGELLTLSKLINSKEPILIIVIKVL